MSFSVLTEDKALPSAVPQAQKQDPSKFLILSPTQSASFEHTSPRQRAVAIKSPPKAAIPTVSAEAITALSSSPADDSLAVHKDRRSSSVSSTNSGVIEKKQFLRLGPVHSGGDPSESMFVEKD